jgi:hypothetical protein
LRLSSLFFNFRTGIKLLNNVRYPLVNKFLKPNSCKNLLIITFVKTLTTSGQDEQRNPFNETVQPDQG